MREGSNEHSASSYQDYKFLSHKHKIKGINYTNGTIHNGPFLIRLLNFQFSPKTAKIEILPSR